MDVATVGFQHLYETRFSNTSSTVHPQVLSTKLVLFDDVVVEPTCDSLVVEDSIADEGGYAMPFAQFGFGFFGIDDAVFELLYLMFVKEKISSVLFTQRRYWFAVDYCL